MKKNLPLLFFFPVIMQLHAQTFQPSVIGSAGTYATFLSGSMSWTIGEVMTETYASAGNFFTQGFHQPDTSLVIAIPEPAFQNISLYPNPVVNTLVIDFSSYPGNYLVEMVDMQGKLLKREQISSSQQQFRISFLNFSNGMYFLNIVNTAANSRISYKINKAE